MQSSQEKLLKNPIIHNLSRFSDNIVELFESFIFINIDTNRYNIQWHSSRTGNINKSRIESSLGPFVSDIIPSTDKFGCFMVTLGNGERLYIDWMRSHLLSNAWHEGVVDTQLNAKNIGILFAVIILAFKL